MRRRRRLWPTHGPTHFDIPLKADTCVPIILQIDVESAQVDRWKRMACSLWPVRRLVRRNRGGSLWIT